MSRDYKNEYDRLASLVQGKNETCFEKEMFKKYRKFYRKFEKARDASVKAQDPARLE